MAVAQFSGAFENFNSNMVRLRVSFWSHFATPRFYFNSNMVRLRVRYYSGHIAKFSISIPTWYDWEGGGRGQNISTTTISIPTWYDWELGSSFNNIIVELNFNSNMVRLRDRDWLLGGDGPVYFNSNMVRLRVAWRSPRRRLSAAFQFQHGTIERGENACNCLLQSYFNSNMVRLRAPGQQAIEGWAFEFQFQHGTIESGGRARPKHKYNYHFNSNMVRLRVSDKMYKLSNNNISIPTWYDWERI